MNPKSNKSNKHTLEEKEEEEEDDDEEEKEEEDVISDWDTRWQIWMGRWVLLPTAAVDAFVILLVQNRHAHMERHTGTHKQQQQKENSHWSSSHSTAGFPLRSNWSSEEPEGRNGVDNGERNHCVSLPL